MGNPVLFQLCNQVREVPKSLSQARANDIDGLALFNSLDFNEFAITSHICVEILIIQSKGFLSSSTVPRFALHIYKDIVGIKCTEDFLQIEYFQAMNCYFPMKLLDI